MKPVSCILKFTGVCVILLALAPEQLAAQVDGRILRVGLFAGSNPIVRSGNWSFVEVELRYTGSAPFDGALRVGMPDGDGDVVVSTLPAALTPDGQWRPYQVYFVPYEIGRGQVLRVQLFDHLGQMVRLRDDTGQEVGELVSAPYADMSPEDLLILDLSTPRKLAHVSLLDSTRQGMGGEANARTVRPLSPRELPVRWQGLEPVDAIVWDDADPSNLSQQQIEAIIKWVEGGGRLLLTAGPNWQGLAASTLASVLPVRIVGAGQETEAQEFLDIVKNEEYRSYLERQYNKRTITRCRVEPLAGALPVPAESEIPQIAYRRLLGRGVLTFVAAPLQQLLPPPKHATALDELAPSEISQSQTLHQFMEVGCEEIVARNFLALPPVWKPEAGGWASEVNLFDEARRAIGFGSSSAIFLIFAILFAVGYTIAAAGGSYWYLQRRSWLHHCWPAFALVAVAGSAVGTVMVWTLRGFSTKLWQATIVDARAGENHAQAACLFGLKTSKHEQLDLAMWRGQASSEAGADAANIAASRETNANGERGAAYVRAMPQSTDPFTGNMHFVAPEDYECVLAGDSLTGVKVRATLKEFQGAWSGTLAGTLEGKLVRGKIPSSTARYEFAEGSYIRNNLGTTLRDCYLLETKGMFADRPVLVNCWRLGDIPGGAAGSELDAQRLAELLAEEAKADADPAAPQVRIKRPPRLDEVISQWREGLQGPSLASGQTRRTRRVRTTEEEYLPLYLLSVFGLIEQEAGKGAAYHRSHGRTWDCLGRVTQGTAVLIGHAETAPLALLEVNGALRRPNKSLTMYRFVIPVERER